MYFLHHQFEGKIIQLGIVIFWAIYWFLNVIDKFINKPTFLWVGKDRVTQFTEYFSSIGIDHPAVSMGFLRLVTILEIVAFMLVAIALWYLIRGSARRAHSFFFWGTFAGLVIFSLFTIGDQIFGDRVELLEHTIYWIALIVSWGAYTYFPRLLKEA